MKTTLPVNALEQTDNSVKSEQPSLSLTGKSFSALSHQFRRSVAPFVIASQLFGVGALTKASAQDAATQKTDKTAQTEMIRTPKEYIQLGRTLGRLEALLDVHETQINDFDKTIRKNADLDTIKIWETKKKEMLEDASEARKAVKTEDPNFNPNPHLRSIARGVNDMALLTKLFNDKSQKTEPQTSEATPPSQSTQNPINPSSTLKLDITSGSVLERHMLDKYMPFFDQEMSRYMQRLQEDRDGTRDPNVDRYKTEHDRRDNLKKKLMDDAKRIKEEMRGPQKPKN